jgi:hypothetical protein
MVVSQGNGHPLLHPECRLGGSRLPMRLQLAESFLEPLVRPADLGME